MPWVGILRLQVMSAEVPGMGVIPAPPLFWALQLWAKTALNRDKTSPLCPVAGSWDWQAQ